MFVEVNSVRKSYGEGSGRVQVLNGISCGIERGEMGVILGASGSGKSTLLNIIGGLETVDEGIVRINNLSIDRFNAKQLSEYRRAYIGFVFQFYNLVPNLTVKENIQVCQYMSENSLDINELMLILGLVEHQNKFPSQLSGGQQQRCAIARALVKNPDLLLCDEPTGALDSVTTKEILKLLEMVNKKYGMTMLIITHNEEIKRMVDRVIVVKDGLAIDSYKNQEKVPANELNF